MINSAISYEIKVKSGRIETFSIGNAINPAGNTIKSVGNAANAIDFKVNPMRNMIYL